MKNKIIYPKDVREKDLYIVSLYAQRLGVRLQDLDKFVFKQIGKNNFIMMER